MCSVLTNPSAYKREQYTTLQKRYLQSCTTDRPQVVKHEQPIQVELCQWLKEVLPGEHFISDTGSGAFNSEYAKEQHNRQQSHKHEPDIRIMPMRRGYGAMVLELKAEGTELLMKRNGTKIRVKTKKVKPTRKYPEGIKIIERDYKISKKGDWASLHIEQNDCHEYTFSVDQRKGHLWDILGVSVLSITPVFSSYSHYPPPVSGRR